MKAFLYAKESSRIGCQLQNMIEPDIKGVDFKVLRTWEDLLSILVRPRFGQGQMISILIADRPYDLMDFLSIAELMSDIWMILVLPNRNRDITSKAFLLRPRFLSYADDNVADTAAVFKKMIAHAKNR